jgi:phosphoserine aminotransferase
MLPESILLEVRDELLNWHDLGMSILEIGQRTTPFIDLLDEIEADLRALMAIPPDYRVLFLGGAARTQFASIPLNFLGENEKAGYLVTGLWSCLAYEEASRLKQAYCVANGEKNGFTDILPKSEWQLKNETRYLYFTPNETVNGLRVAQIPQVGLPLVADMTSCLLTEPVKIEDYALIFAGAQKNIANAGLTLVIVHEAFLNTIQNDAIPVMLDYRTFSETHSLYATLPTFNCYLAGKMFRWIKEQGGVSVLYKRNGQKAAKLYEYIDNSHFYHCKVADDARSLVNVVFTLKDPLLENSFLDGAKARGLLALKGHRTVGGIRASMYNAMPMEGVLQLIEFMNDFAKEWA